MAELCLGTAQWGSAYGVTNAAGRLSQDAVRQIIETALDAGVRHVDSATAYGDAQQRLRPWAARFSITSKISGAVPTQIPLLVEESLDQLGVPSIEAMLIHDWDVLDHPTQIAAAAALGDVIRAGLIRRGGVSVYDDAGIAAALEAFADSSVDLGAIQIPINVLDWRFMNSPSLADAVDVGARIQARSVLLQGLLAVRMPHGLGLHPDVIRYHDWALDQAASPIDLALKHVLAIPWIDEVIVGVTSSAELEQLLNTVNRGAVALAPQHLASLDQHLIDPRQWS